jgi:hypothetical protein
MAGEGIDALFDQIVNLIQKNRAGYVIRLPETALHVHFQTPNSLRLQCGIGGIAVVARIEGFVIVRRAKRPTVICLQVRVRGRVEVQARSRAQRVSIYSIPVAAQTRHQGQVLADEIFVLKIQCPDPVGPMVVKVQVIRLDIVIQLPLPDILPEFRAERDLVSFEKGPGNIALEIPPGSIGGVVIFGERWNSFACIVVHVDSVIAVPIVGEPPKRLPGSERVVILGIDVSASIRRLVPWIVENRAEGGGGKVFRAGTSNDMDIEIPVDDVAKYAVRLVAVGVLSDPIVW